LVGGFNAALSQLGRQLGIGYATRRQKTAGTGDT
jgi:hypothetical protein